ncbi:MAG: NAD(P)-binding protein, partial [Planctomycetota bacterium]
VSLSFILAAPFNAQAHNVFARWRDRFMRFESKTRLPDDQHIEFERPPRAIVVALGRTGTAAYDALREHFGDEVVGLDASPENVRQHVDAGRRVIVGDATDPDLYERFNPTCGCELILIGLQSKSEAGTITRLLRAAGFTGHIVAMARFPDEVEELKEAGVDTPRYLHDEMGIGLASSALECLEVDRAA